MVRSRRAGVVVCFAGLVCLVAGVACSSILGIQDRSLDTQGADAAVDVQAQDTSRGTLDSGAEAADAAEASSPDAPVDAPIEAPPCADPCPLATGLNIPVGVATDSANVYWVEFGDGLGSQDGFVKGCPLTGCGSGPIVYAQAQHTPEDIATDGQNIYWSTFAPAGGGGGIWSCPVAGCTGGTPKLLFGADTPYGIAIDAAYVYWVSQGDDTVHRVLKTGGPDNMLWDASTGGLNNIRACAVDDASVYFVDDWAGVLSVPLAGGAALTINVGNGSANLGNWNVAVDPSSVYFGETGEIVHATKTSTSGGPALVSALAQPWYVTVDHSSGNVYWADYGSGTGTDGTIGKVHPDGSQMAIVASSQVNPSAISVNQSYAVWASAGMQDNQGDTMFHTGAIYRAPK